MPLMHCIAVALSRFQETASVITRVSDLQRSFCVLYLAALQNDSSLISICIMLYIMSRSGHPNDEQHSPVSYYQRTSLARIRVYCQSRFLNNSTIRSLLLMNNRHIFFTTYNMNIGAMRVAGTITHGHRRQVRIASALTDQGSSQWNFRL